MHIVNPLIRDAEPANTERPHRWQPIDWSLIQATHVEQPTTARGWFDMVMAFAHPGVYGGNILEYYEADWRCWGSDEAHRWLMQQMEYLWVWLDDEIHALADWPPEQPRLTRLDGEWYWYRKAAGSDMTEVAPARNPLSPEQAHWHQVMPLPFPGRKPTLALYVASRQRID